jgi:hypothetical protein
VSAAIPLEGLADNARVGEALIPMSLVLGNLPAVTVTDRGRSHVSNGRDLGPADVAGESEWGEWVRVLDASGTLLALATPGKTPGSLHPSVVLI